MVFTSSTIESQVQILTIPTFRMEEFKEKLEKLSRKSERLGLGVISFEIVETTLEDFWYSVDGELEKAKNIPCNTVELNGYTDALSVGGHTFKGAVNHQHSEPMWYPMENGFDLPSAYRTYMEEHGTKASFCEHCNSRRNRHNTFILQNDETGEYVWVGSSCIKDYLGWSNAGSLLSHMQCINEIWSNDPEEFGRGYDPTKIPQPLDVVLPAAFLAIEMGGYRSKSQFGGDSTSAELWRSYWFSSKDLTPYHKLYVGKHCELADSCVDYWMSQESDEFTKKIQTILKDGYLYARDWGIVVYAAFGYMKTKEDEVTSEWFGDIGRHREKLSLRVSKVISKGWDVIGYAEVYRALYLLEDGEGHTFKWGCGECFNVDDRLVMEAVTIKAHEEYNGMKQTVITRPYNLLIA